MLFIVSEVEMWFFAMRPVTEGRGRVWMHTELSSG